MELADNMATTLSSDKQKTDYSQNVLEVAVKFYFWVQYKKDSGDKTPDRRHIWWV